MSAPNLFLVGALRSGTTSFFHFLSGFKDITVPNSKEPGYYLSAANLAQAAGPGDSQFRERVISDRAQFLGLYQASQTRYRCDATATYLHYEGAMQRAADDCRGSNGQPAKAIVLLRDPFDRAVSAFNFQRQRGREPLATLSEALRAPNSHERASWSPMFHYLGASLYAPLLTNAVEAFGADNLLVIACGPTAFGIRAPEISAALETFLDLEAGTTPQFGHVNGSVAASGLRTRAIQVAKNSKLQGRLPHRIRRPLSAALQRVGGRPAPTSPTDRLAWDEHSDILVADAEQTAQILAALPHVVEASS